MRVVLASGNPGKLRELQAMLAPAAQGVGAARPKKRKRRR